VGEREKVKGQKFTAPLPTLPSWQYFCDSFRQFFYWSINQGNFNRIEEKKRTTIETPVTLDDVFTGVRRILHANPVGWIGRGRIGRSRRAGMRGGGGGRAVISCQLVSVSRDLIE